jgi:hypothetical protein
MPLRAPNATLCGSTSLIEIEFMFTKVCVIFRTLNSEARTPSTKPDSSDFCVNLIFCYISDDGDAGLDADNVVVTT